MGGTTGAEPRSRRSDNFLIKFQSSYRCSTVATAVGRPRRELRLVLVRTPNLALAPGVPLGPKEDAKFRFLSGFLWFRSGEATLTNE